VQDDFAERITRRFLKLCENPRTQRVVIGFVQSTLEGEVRSQRLYKYLNRMVFAPLAGPAGMHVSTVRFQLVASTLAGLAMMRYVVKLEPLASMTVDELVPVLAPAVRGALQAEPVGELPAWDDETAPYPLAERHTLDAHRSWKLTGRLAP
jgi:hypothetical protein